MRDLKSGDQARGQMWVSLGKAIHGGVRERYIRSVVLLQFVVAEAPGARSYVTLAPTCVVAERRA